MTGRGEAPPPAAGDWTPLDLPSGGAWSLGALWADRERSCYGMWVRPAHCNAFGVMHGGAMATFADTQLAAVPAHRDAARGHTPTVSLSVDYLAPTPLGSWLELTARLLRATRTLIFAQATVTADGAVVARANAIYRAPPAPPRRPPTA